MAVRRLALLAGLVLSAFTLPGCQLADSEVPVATSSLLPYATPSVTPTEARPNDTAEPAGTPAPSPTPFAHTVREGDTLLGIAYQYGVELDALLTSNPGIDPRFLTIGQSILIPNSEGEPIGVLAPTPTPIPLDYAPPACYSTPRGALWCLALVRNPTEGPVEGVSAMLHLVGPDGQTASSMTAYALVNLLRPGEAVPLAALFPTPPGGDLVPVISPLSAIQVSDLTQRYLELRVERTADAPAEDGRTWRVAGTLQAGEDFPVQTQRAVVALLAYDGQGALIGYAAVEFPGPLDLDLPLAFDLTVFSLAGRIERVELLAEAQRVPEPS